ncbi:MAG: Cro/CI family transcriptional regulator [Nitrococcus sp.]|nr:Cro/CI family transcriptional regulator [Nitrococcus sp.]
MEKQSAIELFGSVTALAAALGITRQAIYQWPEHLSQDQQDRITGAAIRTGLVRKNPPESVPPLPTTAPRRQERRKGERRGQERRQRV